MKLVDLSDAISDDLRDPEFVRILLEENLLEGPDIFLVALGHVTKANAGMIGAAPASSVGRESLCKSLADSGNPEFRTVDSVLRSLGLQLTISPYSEDRRAA